MYEMSIRCPQHQKPLKYIAVPVASSPTTNVVTLCHQCHSQLASKQTQKTFRITEISDHVNKIKQQVHHRIFEKQQKCLESTEDHSLSLTNQDSEGVQSLIEQQANLLEILMKLLAQDKTAYHYSIEQSLEEHRKLCQQYFDIDKDVLYLNKIIKKKLLKVLMYSQGERGWAQMRQRLKKIHHRKYISTKILKESQNIQKELENSATIRGQSILRQLQQIVEEHARKNKAEETNKGQRKQIGMRRSKSFHR